MQEFCNAAQTRNNEIRMDIGPGMIYRETPPRRQRDAPRIPPGNGGWRRAASDARNSIVRVGWEIARFAGRLWILPERGPWCGARGLSFGLPACKAAALRSTLPTPERRSSTA